MDTGPAPSPFAGHEHLWFAVFAALIVFSIYRRLRRNFGAQPLRPKSMAVRIVVLLVVAALLLPVALHGGEFLLLAVAGVSAGAGLGLFAASRTRFEKRDGLLYYIPHTYTGLLVTALFLGRLLYRLFELYATGLLPGATSGAATGLHAGDRGADVYGTQAMLHSPLTVGIFFVLIGYYVTYYCRLLLKSRHLQAGDLEPAATTTPS
jgi:hypothetical protein